MNRFEFDFARIIGKGSRITDDVPPIQAEIDQNNAMRARRDAVDYRRLSEQEMRGATGASQR